MKELNLIGDEDDEIPSDQLKSLFDDYAKRFSPTTSDHILYELSQPNWSPLPDNLTHLTHRIISFVDGRLIAYAAYQDNEEEEDEDDSKSQTVSSLTDFLIGAHEVNKELLIYFKNEELSLKKFAENNRRLFGTLIEFINSFEGTRDYLKAIGQLDSASVNKHNELLLFDACRDFWLSKYKIILKEIPPSATKEKVDEGPLSLNSIKYLITNLIRMQRTTERDYKFSKGQLENFSLKKEYAPRLQMLLPWLSNSCILQNLMELDDSSTDKKMFRQIKNGTYIKLYIDNILGLLLDAKDIQNDTGASKEIIMILIIYVRNINQDDTGFANLFTLLTT
ncbi:unnamed protein product [Rotaria socialis]